MTSTNEREIKMENIRMKPPFNANSLNHVNGLTKGWITKVECDLLFALRIFHTLVTNLPPLIFYFNSTSTHADL